MSTALEGEYLVLRVTLAEPIESKWDIWLGFDLDVDSNPDTYGDDGKGYGSYMCDYDTGAEFTMHYPYSDTGEACFHWMDDGYEPVEAEEDGNVIRFYIPVEYLGEVPASPTIIATAATGERENTDCAIVAGPLGAALPADVPALDPRALGLLAVVLAAAAVIAIRR